MLYVKPAKLTVNYATTSFEGVVNYMKQCLENQSVNYFKETNDSEWLNKKLEERIANREIVTGTYTYIELMIVNGMFPVFLLFSVYNNEVIYKAAVELH